MSAQPKSIRVSYTRQNDAGHVQFSADMCVYGINGIVFTNMVVPKNTTKQVRKRFSEDAFKAANAFYKEVMNATNKG